MYIFIYTNLLLIFCSADLRKPSRPRAKSPSFQILRAYGVGSQLAGRLQPRRLDSQSYDTSN